MLQLTKIAFIAVAYTLITYFFWCVIFDFLLLRKSPVEPSPVEQNPVTSLTKLKLLATKMTSTYFQHYISSLSDSELNELIQRHFGEVSGLNSAPLQRDFMACSGKEILKHFSDVEGVFQIPKQQHTCKNMSFQNSGTPVALASYPGSGNSWVRQLLETSTGIYTGTMFCDNAYIRAGMIGEGVVSNQVIAVKSHYESPKWKFPEKIIYIVRNPFDVFVADWNRLMSKTGNPHISEVSKNYFGK